MRKFLGCTHADMVAVHLPISVPFFFFFNCGSGMNLGGERICKVGAVRMVTLWERFSYIKFWRLETLVTTCSPTHVNLTPFPFKHEPLVFNFSCKGNSHVIIFPLPFEKVKTKELKLWILLLRTNNFTLLVEHQSIRMLNSNRSIRLLLANFPFVWIYYP